MPNFTERMEGLICVFFKFKIMQSSFCWVESELERNESWRQRVQWKKENTFELLFPGVLETASAQMLIQPSGVCISLDKKGSKSS